MFNKYGTLICCAILVCNIHSFCSDWSGTTTRRSSASYREKLDNLQNGLIQQQQNNIQQNRNVNNQQHNNINQQQVNNDDPYGKKIFDKCLTRLFELKNTIEYNTERMKKYISDQAKEKDFDKFLDRKKQNINLRFECMKVITEINKIKIAFKTQQNYNDTIIESNENKKENLYKQIDEIDKEIKNIDSNITKLGKSRVNELNEIQDSILNLQNNVGTTKQDENNIWRRSWYDLISSNIKDDTQIQNCYKILKEMEDLYKLHENKDREYNRIINENQYNKKKLETIRNKLSKSINDISSQNDEIKQINTNCNIEYNYNYLDFFRQYNDILLRYEYINSSKYEETKQK